MGRTINATARALAALSVVLCVLTWAQAALAAPQHERIIQMSAELVKNMGTQNDAEAMAQTVRNAKAVAIFPRTIRAGLGIGGMHGEGVVLVRNANGGWNGPSFASLVGGSFGLQIGVQEVGMVLVVVNDAGLQAFTGGQSFKLGADVGIAAGPVGRDLEAATDSRADASIYSYSMSRGLFAGISLSGSTINVNGDANLAHYGRATDAKTALASPATSSEVRQLTNELDKLIRLAGTN